MSRRKRNPSGGQLALAAGAAILAGLAFVGLGKKPKKKSTPFDPTDTDPLPDNSDGYLPKDKDYGSQIPANMTAKDLWISDDCKAYIVGKQWLPTVNGLGPYMWMLQPAQLAAWEKINKAIMDAAPNSEAIHLIPNAIVIDFGSLIQGRYPLYPEYKNSSWGDFETYAEVGVHPDSPSMVTRFSVAALSGSSAAGKTCADTLFFAKPGVTKAQWKAEYQAWRNKYPALDYLLGFIGAASVLDIQAAIDSHLSVMDF